MMLNGDFYECLVYADDILLLTDTVHSLQMICIYVINFLRTLTLNLTAARLCV